MLRRWVGGAVHSNPKRKRGNGLRPFASLAYAAGYDFRREMPIYSAPLT